MEKLGLEKNNVYTIETAPGAGITTCASTQLICHPLVIDKITFSTDSTSPLNVYIYTVNGILTNPVIALANGDSLLAPESQNPWLSIIANMPPIVFGKEITKNPFAICVVATNLSQDVINLSVIIETHQVAMDLLSFLSLIFTGLDIDSNLQRHLESKYFNIHAHSFWASLRKSYQEFITGD